ncbi:J domain-containing protein [Desertifilum sp. FACHB-1129]|uniref:Molecular chaperone DnaJ n=1 Tax=Desertifilum tharense IPPAS B-1220 TaxID=1781255 RepID=A0A1E5QCN2_9CYAN|nr:MULTISPECIES: J domain-containing protein [Desertifilum]MDA0211663.1 J domain-containing protein [Cyanobacteria bacterium FC1]MDL5045201.1 J domain-containing protein [Oscillatoria amoena NRMC-F 0135]MBD2312170.1 J domain-containing protein [Desertifilum sp. FACHB-1129]MBD2322168.1 J domain-containing protein [Desertifilum sp. FACHB-866]MBD2332205.1 J domain-containing protein [Desertifilum sp. FACHB-868]
MNESNPYHILEVSPTATQAEIKQAYRRLAKRFHPDTQSATADRDRIVQVNAAYEVLSDPQRRRTYDQKLRRVDRQVKKTTVASPRSRYQRAAAGHDTDEQLKLWLSYVYTPVNRSLNSILSSLDEQIDELAADPFDDELIEDFQSYLEQCRQFLADAQAAFSSVPNPGSIASVAAHLYYCLNHVSDGIEELNWFTLNYDEHYLHTGKELFRMAARLRREAQFALRNLAF